LKRGLVIAKPGIPAIPASMANMVANVHEMTEEPESYLPDGGSLLGASAGARAGAASTTSFGASIFMSAGKA
jgi:hypothetical protein